MRGTGPPWTWSRLVSPLALHSCAGGADAGAASLLWEVQTPGVSRAVPTLASLPPCDPLPSVGGSRGSYLEQEKTVLGTQSRRLCERGGLMGSVGGHVLKKSLREPGGRPHASHRCRISAVANPQATTMGLFVSPALPGDPARSAPHKQGGPSSALAYTSKFHSSPAGRCCPEGQAPALDTPRVTVAIAPGSRPRG